MQTPERIACLRENGKLCSLPFTYSIDVHVLPFRIG